MVLAALGNTLRATDEKLSRNAATTVYRLCQHHGMAQLMLASHSSFIDELLAIYQSMGGVQHRTGGWPWTGCTPWLRLQGYKQQYGRRARQMCI